MPPVRLRADEFERERESMLAAVDRCAAAQDAIHQLEWENRKRTDEIRELQQVSIPHTGMLSIASLRV